MHFSQIYPDLKALLLYRVFPQIRHSLFIVITPFCELKLPVFRSITLSLFCIYNDTIKDDRNQSPRSEM